MQIDVMRIVAIDRENSQLKSWREEFKNVVCGGKGSTLKYIVKSRYKKPGPRYKKPLDISNRIPAPLEFVQ